MKAIKVQHVCISMHAKDVTVKFEPIKKKVVCTTPWRSLPPITVFPIGGKFGASIRTATKYFTRIEEVYAKTPAKAFAKAVKAFWSE